MSLHAQRPEKQALHLRMVRSILSFIYYFSSIGYCAYCYPGSTSHATAETATPTSPAATQSPARRNPRAARKVNAQSTRLEAVDDSTDPLGPLGDTSFADEAPLPPQKESLTTRNVRPATSISQSSSTTGMMDSVNLDEEQVQQKGPPPVQPAASVEGAKRQTQPSISVEQAAKPTFSIAVGDPHKVGDLTSSHTVYQVRTKVRSDTKIQPAH